MLFRFYVKLEFLILKINCSQIALGHNFYNVLNSYYVFGK